MSRTRLGLLCGAILGIAAIGACALDEAGTGDGGFGPDVITPPDGGGPDADAAEDVTYDVPDLGTGETESGLPCTCVTSVPTGYTVVEYVANQRPACSTGYNSPADYIENLSASAATCTCACSSTTPSPMPTCSCGGDPATFTIHSGNGVCTTASGSLLANAAPGCYTTQQPVSATGNNLNDMLALPGANCTASGGGCGTAKTSTSKSNPTDDQGRACTLSAALGTCSSGTCIPNQDTPYKLCVTNFQIGSCSALPDFPVAHLVGTGVNDTRGCSGSCSCNLTDAGSCGTPQLQLWNTSNNCGGAPDNTLPADNSTCTPVGYGNATTFTSTRYTISHSGGACSASGNYAATGGVSLQGGFTVCCKP